jgi:hypothetical protein
MVVEGEGRETAQPREADRPRFCVPAASEIARPFPKVPQQIFPSFSLLSQPVAVTHRKLQVERFCQQAPNWPLTLLLSAAQARCPDQPEVPLPQLTTCSSFSLLPSSSFSLSHSVEPSPLPQSSRVPSRQPFPTHLCILCILFPTVTMASTRVLASRLASQMATKAARPAARVTLANTSKRTLTGEFEFGAPAATTAMMASRSGPAI